jgi:FAD/FMN-containing dehydrogenase
MTNILNEIQHIMHTDAIIIDNIPKQYCEDWRKNFIGKPLAVVQPSNVQQISQLVKICQKYPTPIVTQGGNTSLCGASIADNSQTQIVLNLQKMHKIHSINTINRSIYVEAGCTLKQVQQVAMQHDLLYPLSLPSEQYCTIGGNLSTNAGGVSVLKYGNTRQLCLNIEAVLADGSIYNSQQKQLYKNNMGYDIKQLLIGAEGTLGIITAACLRLYPLPKKYHALWLCVPEFDDVLTLFEILQLHFAHALSSFEVMNDLSILCVKNAFPELFNYDFLHILKNTHTWHILVEIEQHGVSIDIEAEIKACFKKNTCIFTYESYQPQQNSVLWNIRHHIPHAQKKQGGNIKHDISLDLQYMADFIATMPQNIYNIDANAKIIVFGHIGDGNLHYNVIASKEYTAYIQTCIYKHVKSKHGSIAAEHGIGQLKTKLLCESINANEYQAMQKIKHIFDPNNILNPNTIFNALL